MTFDQSEFEIRCEWGERGVAMLAPISDAVVIVDVLSFSTTVEIAASSGAIVYPYRFRDGSAGAFAESVGGVLATARGKGGYSLSPASVTAIPSQMRLVLPSPNGATLSLAAGSTPTLAGCLRNRAAVARAARRLGPRIAVIPAGERWPDGSLRPAFEDLVGAGAIIGELNGTLSPEAEAAVAAFRSIERNLQESLMACGSGKELIERGFRDDVELAAELGVSECVPVLIDGSYRDARRNGE